MTSDTAKVPAEEIFELITDQWTGPYWDAARRHVLTVPKCASCGKFRMPPTPFCPHCLSQEIEWPELSGGGTIYSYTVVTRAIIPQMETTLPYVPALVELPDAPGVRLVTNIVDVPVSEIKVGQAVKVRWHDRRDGVTVPCFTF
ncbi:OB-fold domain-containing protein [Aquamicrobium sp. LC103]|uniref:Zn-ribbon domain-containing OB-fold protein n=1 Tax=Aquamicrobium sp. LC103 TaxID=1120658 RepID=UPI00063ECFFE|nr:OB-fold domain-containing protein [Aquamicrobium sp. LC103]TKT74502.1 small subunit of thiolase DitF [Aquamicrobium sp. LC103]